MSAESEIDILAEYILMEIPGEILLSQGAGETTVRILKKYRKAFEDIMNEIGIPQTRYPANIVNAFFIADSMVHGMEALTSHFGDPCLFCGEPMSASSWDQICSARETSNDPR